MVKLFIPGPVDVSEESFKAMSEQMIGHRSKNYAALHGEVVPKLQQLMYTKNRVFIGTSSATGWMEGAVRNCVKKKCLNLVCGAFSERWHTITRDNGKQCEKLEVEWGKAIKPEMVEEKLKTGEFDSVTLVHNETSTGVMNPVKEISEVVRKHDGVLLFVDTVSSMGGAKIPVDELGIDVCLFGTQKDLALPPGLAFCSVSEQAFERAKTVENRGAYFDFIDFDKYAQKNNTPSTPNVSLIRGVNHQLGKWLAEGLDKRYEKHAKMAERVREWGKKNFALFPEPGYESQTLSVMTNTRNISVEDLNTKLKAKGVMIGNGYGKIKEKTFRIAHMGETTLDDINALLAMIDEILGL
ncbi:alanine--glyoxylate aminotransferase family protein [Candidatus Micrarchaeota archaeon]|nr:alanine--glyoxylate aminotransferase family protein [Candidatus Micrarchaeota archaeon]